jgi:prepilin-type N-terminal cleavage/methylation domain-containing protein
MGSSKPVSEDTDRSAGFSLIELSVVIVISLIVGMIAIPNMVTVISNARLHAGLTSISGLLQASRMLAVKQNQTMTAHFGPLDDDTLVAWAKPANDDSDRVATDLQAEWEAPVERKDTPDGVGAPPVIENSVLGFTPQTTEPSFNTRGLPCVYAGGPCANEGFLFYFKDTSRKGNQGWAALSISPAGRIKKWFWTGSAWVD